MNYTLAQELKDAGFPQKEKSSFFSESETPDGGQGWPGVYKPTLSELIEACPHTLHGRGVFFLHSSNAGQLWESGYISFYPPPSITIDKEYSGRGPTPEEAVARLWLALNKKGDAA